MPRERKTIDSWEIHVNYGQGWEHEITEFSYREARQRRKEYRENCPDYPVKIVSRRIPKSQLTEAELNEINR